MSSKASRESSILTGGPRDGWAYWTADLDAGISQGDGYRRTEEFVTNKHHAETGVSRVWRWGK